MFKENFVIKGEFDEYESDYDDDYDDIDDDYDDDIF